MFWHLLTWFKSFDYVTNLIELKPVSVFWPNLVRSASKSILIWRFHTPEVAHFLFENGAALMRLALQKKKNLKRKKKTPQVWRRGKNATGTRSCLWVCDGRREERRAQAGVGRDQNITVPLPLHSFPPPPGAISCQSGGAGVASSRRRAEDGSWPSVEVRWLV